MKKQILSAVALLIAATAMAQDSVGVKVYGFVRSYLSFDSRRTYTAIGGEYNMLPYDALWNEDHTEDLNDVASMQLQALTSRFGIEAKGPRLLGMNSSARLEGDFGGFGTNNHVLRLRLAYMRLSTDNVEVTVGQDWHPLSGDIMPDVLGMAAGAPFRPHSRTPQLRVAYRKGPLGLSAALMYQLQYMNNGPKASDDPTSVASTSFASHALLPEAFVGIDVKHGGWYAQAGLDAQLLRPRTHALTDGVTRSVDETVRSLTPMLYVQYVGGPLSVKTRNLLAQNTSHLNQLVGYGVTGVGSDGTWQYSPMRAVVSYIDVACGKKYKCNLFLGYMKNLGVDGTLYDFGGSYHIYMKGGEDFTHLNSIWRIAPSISYNVKAFSMGIEYEVTAAIFGDLADNGSIRNNENLHQVVNHRLCLLVKYNLP